MIACDTRTATTRNSGLAAGLAALAALEPSALFLDPGSFRPEGAVAAALARANVPVLGVLWRAARGVDLQLACAREPGEAALIACNAAVAGLSERRTRTLVLHCGDGGLDDAVELRSIAGHDAAQLALRRAARSAAVEHAVERLVRRLHVLLGQHNGVRILLRNESDAAALLTPTTAEWLLSELAPRGLGLALDRGAAELAALRGGATPEQWIEMHGRATGLLFLSDHDGGARCDLLPGMGRTTARSFAAWRAGQTPRVLCLDPQLDAISLAAAAPFAAQLCGER